VLPTRTLFSRLISSSNFVKVAIGIFGGTWTICGLAHLSQVPFTYYLFNWPEPIWNMLIPIIPVENALRGLSGAVIGTGVISGLRAINLVKPKESIYELKKNKKGRATLCAALPFLFFVRRLNRMFLLH
jgi:hypothetical protein